MTHSFPTTRSSDLIAIFPVSIAQPHINRAHPARIIHIISKGGDEGSGPQDCSLGQALRLQFPVEVSALYGRLSTHVAYISGESAGKFQFCLGECFGRSAPRSEENTSDIQSLMRISSSVLCLH